MLQPKDRRLVRSGNWYSRIQPRGSQSSRQSRENFRESSRLTTASSRGLAPRTGVDPFRRTLISSFAYLRSVDRWRRARRHRPVTARRRSTSTEQLFCANPVASTSKRRGRVFSLSLSSPLSLSLPFSLSLSLSLFLSSLFRPWSTPSLLSLIGCRARRILSLLSGTRSFLQSSSLSI